MKDWGNKDYYVYDSKVDGYPQPTRDPEIMTLRPGCNIITLRPSFKVGES
jgi:hypothetical protein